MEQAPKTEEVLFILGAYQVLKKIGQGGMGEVFLAYDPTCGRRIALKRMRADRALEPKNKEQFLNEACITSQLDHPSIVPIYSIVQEEANTYFTMPYLEGQTLKEIIENTRQRESEGKLASSLGSISTLSYIFLQICRTIAYAHSKGFIHRDIKTSNIIIGAQGEVRLLDWGLIQPVVHEASDGPHLISGTMLCLPPEIILGQAATVQTDIYALGVILYQILTLRYPFHRTSLQEYRDSLERDVLVEPIKVAPERNIPPLLSKIAVKCLAPNPAERYPTASELIKDLESYLENKANWIEIEQLDPKNPSAWNQHQKNAVPKKIKGDLLLSKSTFVGSLKLSVNIRIGPKSDGVGFILNCPERWGGIVIWFSADAKKPADFINVSLERDKDYNIRIDKIRNNIFIYINNNFSVSHVSQVPLSGGHIGIIGAKNDVLCPLSISTDARSLHENHLSVPDAFFAKKSYSEALEEYKNVAHLPSESSETVEAQFCAGVVLLEEAKNCKKAKEKDVLGKRALNEFSQLCGTSGAPLEYLGLTLYYSWKKDTEKEVKTFEEAFQKFPHHHLIYRLKDQLIYRIHESKTSSKRNYYSLILAGLRYLPAHLPLADLEVLKTQLKTPNFIDKTDIPKWGHPLERALLAIELAFRLNQPQTIASIILKAMEHPPTPVSLLESGLLALHELKEFKLAKQTLDSLFTGFLDVQAIGRLNRIKAIINAK